MVQRDFKGSELILCVIVISIYTVINLSKPKKYTIKWMTLQKKKKRVGEVELRQLYKSENLIETHI